MERLSNSSAEIKAVGLWARQLREDAGLTAESLCQQLDFPLDDYIMLEAGQYEEVCCTCIKMLCQFYNISMRNLPI